jgi:hypothetical protein
MSRSTGRPGGRYGCGWARSGRRRPEIYRHEDGLNRVWKNSILPLLAEHHYGGPPSLLNRYRLASLLGESAADEDGP